MLSRATIFSREPNVRAEAHGRVNLIGEHTDYNQGFVLPMQIPQKTTVELAARDDSHVIVGTQSHIDGSCRYLLGSESRLGLWSDYVQGVTSILGSSGYALSGFEAWIRSDVPMGAGLSSSAALEVALIRALSEAFGLKLSGVEIAKLCQRIENEFVGARVGIMDPMASALGSETSALFLDTQNLSYRLVNLDLDRMRLFVIHSGLHHRNAGGGYNERRAECERAAEALGVSSLRELSSDNLDKLQELPLKLMRRARHVITENQRVLDAVAALESGDAKALGKLFYASHLSLRDDYDVSLPEIDVLVEVAIEQPEVFGARLTGGGFGGSVVVLAMPDAGQDVVDRIARRYQHLTGEDPVVLVPARPIVPVAAELDRDDMWDFGHR